jgi:site-specific DNA recombinase
LGETNAVKLSIAPTGGASCSRACWCAACAAAATRGKDRYGCAAHRSKGTCGNDRTIGRQAIESRVLDGLKHRLLAPDLFEEFARSYQEECNRLALDAVAGRAAVEGRLAQVERKIASIIRAVEDGLYQPSTKERLGALEAEMARLAAERAAKADTPAVALHPNLPALYRKKVKEFEAVLADAELGAEAMDAIPLDDHAHRPHARRGGRHGSGAGGRSGRRS